MNILANKMFRVHWFSFFNIKTSQALALRHLNIVKKLTNVLYYMMDSVTCKYLTNLTKTVFILGNIPHKTTILHF